MSTQGFTRASLVFLFWSVIVKPSPEHFPAMSEARLHAPRGCQRARWRHRFYLVVYAFLRVAGVCAMFAEDVYVRVLSRSASPPTTWSSLP